MNLPGTSDYAPEPAAATPLPTYTHFPVGARITASACRDGILAASVLRFSLTLG